MVAPTMTVATRPILLKGSVRMMLLLSFDGWVIHKISPSGSRGAILGILGIYSTRYEYPRLAAKRGMGRMEKSHQPKKRFGED